MGQALPTPLYHAKVVQNRTKTALEYPMDHFPVPPENSFVQAAIQKVRDARFSAVSFDVFDTVFKRKAVVPTSLFESLLTSLQRAASVGVVQTPGSFRALREAAEQKARSLALQQIGTEEVTLAEIWDQLRPHLATSLSIDQLTIFRSST